LFKSKKKHFSCRAKLDLVWRPKLTFALTWLSRFFFLWHIEFLNTLRSSFCLFVKRGKLQCGLNPPVEVFRPEKYKFEAKVIVGRVSKETTCWETQPLLDKNLTWTTSVPETSNEERPNRTRNYSQNQTQLIF